MQSFDLPRAPSFYMTLHRTVKSEMKKRNFEEKLHIALAHTHGQTFARRASLSKVLPKDNGLIQKSANGQSLLLRPFGEILLP